MDELALQKASQELAEVRDQLRVLRTEIFALEEKEMRGMEDEVAGELSQLREQMNALRVRHDELANFVEGDLSEADAGLLAGVTNFLADYKWPLIGVAAMAVVVTIMFQVSQPTVTEEERAKVQASLKGEAEARMQQARDEALDQQHRNMRDMQRAMDGGGARRP